MIRKIEDFRVITDYNIKAFREKVDEAKKKGFQLHGESVKWPPRGGPRLYLQATIKYEDDVLV